MTTTNLPNKPIAVAAFNGTGESVTEWLKEVNDFDDKPFRKIGKEKTNEEIADMFLSKELKLDDAIYLGLPIARLKVIADILGDKLDDL